MTVQPQPSTLVTYIGSYAEAANSGLYTCLFNEQTGSLTLIEQTSGLQNPTFLAIDQPKQKLYALSEHNTEGQRSGAIRAYDIERENGKLSLLNDEASVAAPTCHISLDRAGQFAFVASYSGGLVGLSLLQEDGRIGPNLESHQHSGSSIRPQQDRPHPHSAYADPDNRFVLVPDLGMDRIVIYRLDHQQHKLLPHGEVALAPGAGPRHFVFHPMLATGYVINELNSTITVFQYDAELGQLTEVQSISTLPDYYTGSNACADIHISSDGRFLYGSNRGHDSIAVFQIDPSSGELTLVEHTATIGEHPRNFALSPDNRFLLVANRDTDNVVTFARDAGTGKLEPTGDILNVSKPVCIQFLLHS